MNRSQVINKSFKIVFQNESLWVVSIITLGSFTAFQIIFPQSSAVLTIIITLLSFAIPAFLSGALIHMVNTIAEGHFNTVKAGFEAAIRNFIPMLGLRAALSLPIWLISMILSRSYIDHLTMLLQPNETQLSAALPQTGAILCAQCSIALLSILLYPISIGADRAVVLEGMLVVDALKRALQLLRDKVGDFIVIGIILAIVGIVPAVLMTCCLSVTDFSQALGDHGISEITSSLQSFKYDPFSNIPVFIIYTLINLLFQSFIRLLQSSTWTLAFRHWQEIEMTDQEGQLQITAE